MGFVPRMEFSFPYEEMWWIWIPSNTTQESGIGCHKSWSCTFAEGYGLHWQEFNVTGFVPRMTFGILY